MVDHWWCGGIHRVQPGMIKLFRRRTAAAGFYNIYSQKLAYNIYSQETAPIVIYVATYLRGSTTDRLGAW